MARPLVAVATSAYGADFIRTHGQEHVLPIVARSGAAAIEIRRELFAAEVAPLLPGLRRAIAGQGLLTVYSVPLELWRADGLIDAEPLAAALKEAAMLEARWLKVSLGHYRAECDLLALAQVLAVHGTPLVIENDQTAQGGDPVRIAAFLNACGEARLRIGLTFDIGNWQWTGHDPLQAAALLGPHVQYVHCKGVLRDGGKLKAVPPQAELAQWPALFAHFRPAVMRAIEFPLIGADLTAVTTRHVADLGAL